MFSPKYFDNFSPEGGCSEGLNAFKFFLNIYITVLPRIAISIQIKYLHEIKQKIERNHTFYCLYNIINHYYAGILKSNQIKQKCVSVCVCVCVCVFFPFILDVKFVGCTSRGHTGFLIHLPSAVHAFIFLARRIQPLLSLVTVKPNLIVLHLLGIYIF